MRSHSATANLSTPTTLTTLSIIMRQSWVLLIFFPCVCVETTNYMCKDQLHCVFTHTAHPLWTNMLSKVHRPLTFFSGVFSFCWYLCLNLFKPHSLSRTVNSHFLVPYLLVTHLWGFSKQCLSLKRKWLMLSPYFSAILWAVICFRQHRALIVPFGQSRLTEWFDNKDLPGDKSEH